LPGAHEVAGVPEPGPHHQDRPSSGAPVRVGDADILCRLNSPPTPAISIAASPSGWPWQSDPFSKRKPVRGTASQ
jgi:hypothetical protein